VFAELERRGWHRDGDRLVAPNGTMWFDTTVNWPPQLSDLLLDMRRERIERLVEDDPTRAGPALADVSQVLDALSGLLGE
jgi:hypothetical protein